MEIVPDTAPIEPTTEADAGQIANGKGKLRLLHRSQLDGRTSAAKAFDHLLSAIIADLGGHGQLSAIELTMAEAYVGAAIVVDHLNARLVRGEEIDFNQHSQAASTMLRLGTRLGLQRRAKTVGPTLGELLRADIEQQRAEPMRRQYD
jgi:hypothetical protein